MADRVLLLDAHLRHALAIVRSLGRRGISVVCASPNTHYPARYSRYSDGHADIRPDGDPQSLLRVIDGRAITLVIAGGLSGQELLCRYRQALEPRVRGAFNDLTTFDSLANKARSGVLADRIGLRRPMTRSASRPADAQALIEELGSPVVLKSPVDQGTVRYAHDKENLKRLIIEFQRDHPELIERGDDPLVQQYVRGSAHGFYALADRGSVQAYFMHRRLHEVPPTGGPSAMATSYRCERLKELGERIISAAGWHGVAMVEFKKSLDDGEYYLIEVNPKFWGSLGLSVSAGVDFPMLLYKLLIGAPLAIVPGAYRDEVVFRSLTMDLAYSVAAHRVRAYLRAFADRRVVDDFDRRDILPSALLFAAGARRVTKQGGSG